MQAMTTDRRKAAKDATKITTEIISVTPQIAAAWLDQNLNNRKVSGGVIGKYVSDMKAGKWKLTGDSIKFDTSNRLLDGQHRLHACVRSKSSFQTIVVYGLPPETQALMDLGKARSASDVMSMRGMHNTSCVQAACRVLLCERAGMDSIKAFAFSVPDILAVLDQHPKLVNYCFPPGKFPRGISVGQVAYISYVAAEKINQRDRAMAMLDVLKTGVPSYDGDPIHLYRERIMRTRDATERIRAEARWWTFKHCWNLFAVQEPVRVLRFDRTNPAIRGLNISKHL